MTFSTLIRILIWSWFAVVASYTTNAAFGLTSLDPQHVSIWQSKDAGLVAPSRIQVVAEPKPFKSNAGSSRFGSAKSVDDFAVGLPSASSTPVSAHLPLAVSLHHLDQSSNGPRAPPFI